MTLLKVLVVDDEEGWLQAWSDYLKLCGCKHVDTASSLVEVKKIVNSENLYDLYLVDSLRDIFDQDDFGDWKPVAEHIKAIHPEAKILINTAILNDSFKEAVETSELGLDVRLKGEETSAYIDSLV